MADPDTMVALFLDAIDRASFCLGCPVHERRLE
jgi:hypothetical protein